MLQLRILHAQNFDIHFCLTESTQAKVFVGQIKDITQLHMLDRLYVAADRLVIIKQFEMTTERKGFKKEVKLLKRIK